MNETKIETNWKLLFEKFSILDQIEKEGKFIIKSGDIVSFHEARLMVKFDHSFQLPKIFSDNNLSILPITRGNYILSNFNTFCNFSTCNEKIHEILAPDYIESIDFKNITSEAIALNSAYLTGIIEDFTEDEMLMPTLSGRMSSQSFDFNIALYKPVGKYINIGILNSQIEIDASYEGLNTINLVEAKNSISSDFIIRQLYYPYRLLQANNSKQIRPIFMTYTNGIYHLREFAFDDLMYYNSIRLVKEKRYRIKESSDIVINIETIQNILNTTKFAKEPEIPFTQANSFERIINLCEILSNKEFITKENLNSDYDFKQKDSFDDRQVDYYTNAARYLGFVERGKTENNDVCYYLTKKGRKLFEIGIHARQLEFIRAILSHSVYHKTMSLYIAKSQKPTKNEIIQIMKESDLFKIDKESTFERRSSTINAWVNWIFGQITE